MDLYDDACTFSADCPVGEPTRHHPDCPLWVAPAAPRRRSPMEGRSFYVSHGGRSDDWWVVLPNPQGLASEVASLLRAHRRVFKITLRRWRGPKIREVRP